MFDTAVECEAEAKRQNTYYNEIRVVVDINESSSSLPIVELVPFVKKSWRRDKSLPNFHTSRTKSADFTPISVDKIVAKYDKTTIANHIEGENQKGKVNPHVLNINNMNSERLLPRTHPQTRTVLQCSHSQSFHTPADRYRGTRINNFMEEKNEQSSENIVYYKGRTKASHNVDLQGNRLRNIIKRKPFSYLDTYSQFTARVSGDTARKNPSWTRAHTTVKDNDQHKTVNVSTVYDDFDRNGSLPSIYVRHTSPRLGSYSEIDSSEGKTQTSPRSETGKKRIKNSFEILRESGPPAPIERHVTHELAQTLTNLRRSQSMVGVSPAVDLAPKHFGHVSVSYRGGPTQGELLLRKGRQSNSKKPPKPPGDQGTSDATVVSYENRDSGIQSPVESEPEMETHEHAVARCTSRDPIAAALKYAEERVMAEQRIKLPDCVLEESS